MAAERGFVLNLIWTPEIPLTIGAGAGTLTVVGRVLPPGA
jgi:hypothetical protein